MSRAISRAAPAILVGRGAVQGQLSLMLGQPSVLQKGDKVLVRLGKSFKPCSFFYGEIIELNRIFFKQEKNRPKPIIQRCPRLVLEFETAIYFLFFLFAVYESTLVTLLVR